MNEKKLLKAIVDFYVMLIKIVLFVLLVGLTAFFTGVTNKYMGTQWAYISTAVFVSVAIMSYVRQLDDVNDPLRLLEGVTTVIIQYIFIVFLFFVVCIVSEILRQSVDQLVGWGFFAVFTSVIILTNVDICDFAKESI